MDNDALEVEGDYQSSLAIPAVRLASAASRRAVPQNAWVAPSPALGRETEDAVDQVHWVGLGWCKKLPGVQLRASLLLSSPASGHPSSACSPPSGAV